MNPARNFYGKLESALPATDSSANVDANERRRSSILHDIQWSQLMDRVRGLDTKIESQTSSNGLELRQESCPDVFEHKQVNRMFPEVKSSSSKKNLSSRLIYWKDPANLSTQSASSVYSTSTTLQRAVRSELQKQNLNDHMPSIDAFDGCIAVHELTTDPETSKTFQSSTNQKPSTAMHAESARRQSASCTAGAARALAAALRSALPLRRGSATT